MDHVAVTSTSDEEGGLLDLATGFLEGTLRFPRRSSNAARIGRFEVWVR